MNNKFYNNPVTVGLWVLLWLLLCMQSLRAQNITKAEYYIDNDPGIGQATDLPITPGTDVTKTFTININSLSPGFHNLFVRTWVKPYTITESYQIGGQTITNTYTKGGWSLTSVRALYKETFATNSTSVNVTKGEYYVDTDPGFGKGINIPIAAGKDLTNVNFVINVSALINGFHNVFVRFQDASKNWSLSQMRTFYKEDVTPGNTTLANIIKGEYYIDEDPGFGNGTTIPITRGNNLNNVKYSVKIKYKIFI